MKCTSHSSVTIVVQDGGDGCGIGSFTLPNCRLFWCCVAVWVRYMFTVTTAANHCGCSMPVILFASTPSTSPPISSLNYLSYWLFLSTAFSWLLRKYHLYFQCHRFIIDLTFRYGWMQTYTYSLNSIAIPNGFYNIVWILNLVTTTVPQE